MKFQEIKYSEQEKQAFKEEFAKRKKRQWAVAGLVLLMAAPVIYMRVTDKTLDLPVPVAVIGPLFAGLVLATLIFSFWNWRCPACKKYLGRSAGPAYCPKCGVAFE